MSWRLHVQHINPGTIKTAQDVQIHVSRNVSLLIEIKNFFQIMTHQIQVMTSVRVQIYVKIRKGYKNWNTLRCVMVIWASSRLLKQKVHNLCLLYTFVNRETLEVHTSRKYCLWPDCVSWSEPKVILTSSRSL